MAFYIGEIVKLRDEFFEAHKNGDYMAAVMLGTKIVELYEENDDCHTMEYATDLNNLAIAYDDVCLYDKATKYYQAAAKLKKELTGESLTYADTLNNLAITLSHTQKYTEAVDMQRRVMEIRERLLGRNHEDYIMSLYNMGNAYEDAGNLTKALELHQKALSKARRYNNINNMDYSDILNSLGRIYEQTGNYSKSLDAYKKSSEMTEKELGKNNYLMMKNYTLIAGVAEKAGCMDMAVEYCKKAIDIRREILDKNHLDFISSLNVLGAIYCKNKQYEQAVEVHNEVLEIVKNILGTEHPFYADTLHNIGMDYCGWKDYEKAISYNEEALERKADSFGENHLQYAASLLNLGTVYKKMGDYEKALEFFRKTLEVRNENYHGDHASCADVLIAIGKIYELQDDYEKASQYYNDAIRLRRRISAFDDDGYIWSLELLGHARAYLHDEAGATKALWDAAEQEKKNYGTKHPKYARVLFYLGEAYMILGRFQDAAEALKDAAEIEEITLGEQNPTFLSTLERLAMAQYKSEDFQKAVENYKRCHDLNFEETVKDQIKAAKMESSMGNCYLQLGEKEKANAYYQKAVEKMEHCGNKNDKEWLMLQQERRNIVSQQSFRKSDQLLKKVKSTYSNTFLSAEKENMSTGEVPTLAQSMSEGEMQQLDEAGKLLMKIYDLRTSRYGMKDKEALEAAIALGDLYKTKGCYEDAMFWYQKAEKQGDGMMYAEAGRKMGVLYLYLKDYDRAVQKLANIKNYMEEYETVKCEAYIDTLGYLGDVYFHKNERVNAIRIYLPWIKLKKEMHSPKTQLDLERMESFAGLLLKEDRKKEALEYFSELALDLREAEGENLRFARIILKIANLDIEMGQLESATALLEKAALLYQADKGENSVIYGKIKERLGNLYFHHKEWGKAEVALAEAASISRGLGEDGFFSQKAQKQLELIRRKKRENKKDDDNPWEFLRNLFSK